MSSTSKLYAFAALVFLVGAIAALVGGHWGSLAIFVVLIAMMLWVIRRVEQTAASEEQDPRPRK